MKSANCSLIIGATLAFLCGAAVWTIQREKTATLFPEQYLFQHAAAKLFPDHPLHSGVGSHENPFQLSRLQAAQQNDLPFLINTDDDPNHEFDSHPLSASDLAVLLQSLQENGVSRVMLGATHAWNRPDPFALDALKTQCSGFAPCITSGVLGRGAVTTAMPSAFVRASIPISAVKGNSRFWPQVNRVSIENTFFGEENTWAGFSRIDSEETSPDKAFLVARWEDRIIFSAPLLALLAHENCRPDELVIESGKSIRLPREGKIIPIDDYGRITLRPLPFQPPALLAWQLLRPEPAEREILKNGGSLVQILDQSKEFGEAHHRDSQNIQQLLQNLYQSPSIGHTLVLRRLPGHIELLLLATLCLQLATLHSFGLWARRAALLLIVVLLALACYAGLTWIPFTPALASMAASLYAFRRQPPAHIPMPLDLVFVNPNGAVEPAVVKKAPKTVTTRSKKSAPTEPVAVKVPAQKMAETTTKKTASPAKKKAKTVIVQPQIEAPAPPISDPPPQATPVRKKARKISPGAKKKGKG